MIWFSQTQLWYFQEYYDDWVLIELLMILGYIWCDAENHKILVNSK